MARRRFLPKYVTSFIDRHGKEWLRFRCKGFPSYYFKAPLGTEEFREEYRLCNDPEANAPKPPVRRAKPGTLDDLVDYYYSPITRLGPTQVTQLKVMAVIDDFRKGRGDRMVKDVRFHHLDAIIAKKREKTMVQTKAGMRPTGGVHAARKLRKELIRLFGFAKKIGMIDHNPAEDTDIVRERREEKTGGFHCWTEEEINTFRARWPIGSRERLGMELILWTDQRRSDVVRMGREQIKDGRIPVVQEKTGKRLWLPLAPQLVEAIVAMQPHETSPSCFLVTKKGTPFTKESFGNFFRKACSEAGLDHCSAHGLRKATLRRMAELEMANSSMKSVSGQTRDETLAEYIRTANQKALAESAINQLSAWERTQGV